MSSTAPQVCHERSVELEAQLEELEAQSSSSKRNQVQSDAQRREEGSAAEAHHAAAAGVAEAAFGRWPIRRDPGSRLGKGVDWVDWGGLGGLGGQPWAAQGWDTDADGEATARKRFAGMLLPSKLEITHD